MTEPSTAESPRQQSASIAGKARMARLTPEERRELAAQGGKSTARKRTAEERREHMRKASSTYWTRMSPEQRSEAVKARVRARSPEPQRKISRKAIETRWARAAYAANPQDADRLYAYLEKYIAAKRYAPTVKEISRALQRDPVRIRKSLHILERIGRIERHPWERGIVLNGPIAEFAPALALETTEATCLTVGSSPPVTVERAINWKLIAKAFEGVPISRLTAAAIARHFRQRTTHAGQQMAEREANVLLALRFPEIFLERRKRLESLTEFLDIPRAKRGCKSCGRKFQKVRPNQRYCSARCRASEKRRRRGATAHGKLLKAQQNARYRDRYTEKERERRRQWKASNREKLQAQKDREHIRRRLNSSWNQKLSWKLPPSIAALRIASNQLD